MLDKNNAYNKIILFSVGETKEARMLIQDWKGYPRVSVFTRSRNKKSRAELKINFAINKHALYVIVNELEDLVKHKDEYSVTVDMFAPVWENDQQTNDIKKAGSLTLGKKEVDGDFINYITLESKDGLKFSFKLLPSPYVKLLVNGTPLDNGQTSNKWTLAYAVMLKGILDLSLDAMDGDVSKDELTKSKTIDSDSDIKELQIL